MDALIVALQAIGLPAVITGVLVTATFLIQQYMKERETKQVKPVPDSDIKQNSAILKNLIEDLTEAKQREDECSRLVAATQKERDALLVQREALQTQIAAKQNQIDALFQIMRRDAANPGEAVTDRSLTRMRAWMVEHISDDGLDIVAADAGLSQPIKTLGAEGKAHGLIEEARQKNMLGKLENAVLARAPTVVRW